MAIGLTRWRSTIAECWHDPAWTWQLALNGSGAVEKAGLLLTPLFMTPSGYSAQVKSGGMAGLVRLWTGAGLWVVAMHMMISPAMQQVEAGVAKLGTAAGYWDPMFTGKAAGGLLMASSFAIFGIVATMRWLIPWIALALETAFGKPSTNPPPFGYHVTQTAGEISALAVLISALIFSLKPLNAPVWSWLQNDGLLQFIAVLTFSAILFLCMHLKSRTGAVAATEIYGKVWKAAAYELGIPAALLVGMRLWFAL
jgi:hypothetical protein